MPPEEAEFGFALVAVLVWGAVSLFGTVFWLWMCVDCYRRLGLNVWHYLFVFFPPSTLAYFIINARDILRFTAIKEALGMGLKSRIKRAEHQLRVSDTVAARTALAELYFAGARYADSEVQFRAVLAADEENNEAAYYIGLCRLRQNDAAGALPFLERVMQRERKLRFGVAWLRYTDTLLAVGRRDEALEERRKLCRSFPRPLTEFAYAQLLAAAAQKDKAREVLDEMLATSAEAPAEDRQWLSQGRALLAQLQ